MRWFSLDKELPSSHIKLMKCSSGCRETESGLMLVLVERLENSSWNFGLKPILKPIMCLKMFSTESWMIPCVLGALETVQTLWSSTSLSKCRTRMHTFGRIHCSTSSVMFTNGLFWSWFVLNGLNSLRHANVLAFRHQTKPNLEKKHFLNNYQQLIHHVWHNGTVWREQLTRHNSYAAPFHTGKSGALSISDSLKLFLIE